jgi:zinc protease
VRTKLPNGLRLLVRPEPSVPLVAMRGAWLGGLRYERPRTNGINSLMASLITRGTATRSGDEIVTEVEGMAGSIGGFTGRNSLGVRLETLSRHFSESFEILADCLLHPEFSPEEFQREQQLALQEIATRDDNLTGATFRLFQRTLFRRHPYRFSLAGEAASVDRLTHRSLQRYFRRHYRPGGLVLSVSGDVDPDEVLAATHRLLGQGAPQREAAPQVPREPKRSGPQEAVRHLDRQQAHVLLGFEGVTVKHRDRFTLEVLAAVLSGQGGRLFVNIRDRLGLVYRISAFSLEGIDPGYFAVYAATSPGQLEQLLGEIRAELKRLRRQPVGAAELRRAKRYLIGHHDLSLQQRTTLATTLAFNELYGLGYAAHLTYPEGIEAVTAKDLTRAARRYLAPGRETVAIVRAEEPAG